MPAESMPVAAEPAVRAVGRRQRAGRRQRPYYEAWLSWLPLATSSGTVTRFRNLSGSAGLQPTEHRCCSERRILEQRRSVGPALAALLDPATGVESGLGTNGDEGRGGRARQGWRKLTPE